jgi:hypothetical protein
MVGVPPLHPLGPNDRQLGIWAGVSVHEVGQVIAAARPAGQAAGAIDHREADARAAARSSRGSRQLRNRQKRPDRRRTGVPSPADDSGFVLSLIACVLVRRADIYPAQP